MGILKNLVQITKNISEITYYTTKYTAQGVGLASKGACKGAKLLYDNREEIGGAISGAVKGTADVVRDASGHLLTNETFEPRRRVLEKQSQLYHQLAERYSNKVRTGLLNKKNLLDTLIVGGETVGAYLHMGEVPGQIQQAYELAYPNVAASHSYTDQIDSLDGAELVGFASGIKGKLFEIEYADYLNNGHLPEGYTAEIASSPTNPGWDIAIRGEDGDMLEAIQAKATDSANYVKEALEKNPHIDIVTTSEVHSHLVMQGLGDNVIDGGMTNAELIATIDGSMEDASSDIDFIPSAAMLALIAFSAYSDENLSSYQKYHEFGERSVKTYVAYLAGGSIAAMTGTLWLGILGGMGSRLLLDTGKDKVEELERIERLIETNKTVIARLSRQVS